MRKKIIRVYWNDPISLEESLQSPLTMKPGLYYLSRVWGTHETSLYLGKASNTIRERLKTHNAQWLPAYRGTIYVRVGQIIYPRHADAEVIDHAESALIFEHRDTFIENTDKRFSYSYSELYQVENIGDIGELQPVVDMYAHIE